MVLLDTDFLSSFFKIGKLKLILKALNVGHLIIPSTVYGELKDSKFFNELVSSFAFNEENLDDEKYILVKEIKNPREHFDKEKTKILGDGELGCFLLAKESNETILIDDQRARRIAKEEELKVTSIPAFLLHCKKKKILSTNEIKQIMENLKEKDYYEFSAESADSLLT
jgi:predicted nucleic acid-binding protein